LAKATVVPPEPSTNGMVKSEAVRNIVKSDDMVYMKLESLWNIVMRLTSGPNKKKLSFRDVWIVLIVCTR